MNNFSQVHRVCVCVCVCSCTISDWVSLDMGTQGDSIKIKDVLGVRIWKVAKCMSNCQHWLIMMLAITKTLCHCISWYDVIISWKYEEWFFILHFPLMHLVILYIMYDVCVCSHMHMHIILFFLWMIQSTCCDEAYDRSEL